MEGRRGLDVWELELMVGEGGGEDGGDVIQAFAGMDGSGYNLLVRLMYEYMSKETTMDG